MKFLKYLTFIILLASFCACNNSERDSVEYTEVNFRVEVPNKNFTRSVGTGSIINTLYVEARSVTGEKVRGKFPMSVESGGNARLSLAKGQSYDIIFWAQWEGSSDSQDSPAYDITDDLSKVKMIFPTEETEVVAMEKYDAFYATMKNVIVDGSKSLNVELSRPLAQMNILSNNTFGKAQVKLTQIPTTFNTLSGTFGDYQDVTVTFDQEKNRETLTVNGVEYKHLAMMYLFANPTGDEYSSELVLTNGGNSSTITLQKIKFESNCKTNIIGNY